MCENRGGAGGGRTVHSMGRGHSLECWLKSCRIAPNVPIEINTSWKLAMCLGGNNPCTSQITIQISFFRDLSCGYYDPTTNQPTYTYCGIDDAKQKAEFLEYPGSVLTYEDCGNQSRSISLNFCRRVEATKKRSKLQVPRILTPHQSQLEVGGASLNKK